MTVLDTDFLVALLRGDTEVANFTNMIDSPKTTVINAFELYYGAKRSTNIKKSIAEVKSLLNSMDILEFDNSAVIKSAQIQADLMNSGKPVNILDVLIGGIVIVNNEDLLSRNTNHFNRIKGLKCMSW